VLVLTGDPTLPDPTKWGGAYSAHDRWLHGRMLQALAALDGYAFEFFDVHERLIERLAASARPDWVLNFCDTGFGNVATRELHVPALLELFELPYSGSGPACLGLCHDKAIVGLIAQACGIPVPREVSIAAGAPADGLLPQISYPAFVKPARGDGSLGINRGALVRSPAEARRQLEWLRDEVPGGPALLQEYLPGPEYGLALIGNPAAGLRALPALEVDYSALAPELPPILAFASKTGPANPYTAVRLRQARLEPARLERLRGYATTLFARLGCRDYARFDFRAGTDGEIKLLEVNPNPAWDIESKVTVMGSFAGRSYAETLRLILEAVETRLLGR
jgi:D-alanine-D-alanine ligase